MRTFIPSSTNRAKQTAFRVFWLKTIVMLFVLHAPNTYAAPGDLVIPRNENAEMSADLMVPSIFQHWVHRIRFRCDACHDSLFEMELGKTDITMDMMAQKQSCGLCHDGEIAFAVGYDTCERCHRPADK